MLESSLEFVGTVLFALAVVHTFSVQYFQKQARLHPEGSIKENLYHFLGEVEVVFGIWAGIFCAFIWLLDGHETTVRFLESLNFTEPLFVFVIMSVAATRPILQVANTAIALPARLLPIHPQLSFFLSALTIGPLLGSFITEPAAMTVTALVLFNRYFSHDVSLKFRYATLATLFVNVSIGGVLTPYAAPPVLMVASKWGWNLSFMLQNFGWKAAIGVCINAIGCTYLLRRSLKSVAISAPNAHQNAPAWLCVIHLMVLALVVANSHHAVIFIGVFLFFLGVAAITQEHQTEIKLKESLLVAFFLAGLVVLGTPQRWWLEPLLNDIGPGVVFLGATALTAIVDNAALTYLGTQVPGLLDAVRYALVAGAVAGGGLTVIANAPNPAGLSILKESFGPDGVSPLRLFLYAAPLTLVAMACLWIL